MQGVRGGENLPAPAHLRQRSTCKDCGGAKICLHQRIRSRCKEYGGGGLRGWASECKVLMGAMEAGGDQPPHIGVRLGDETRKHAQRRVLGTCRSTNVRPRQILAAWRGPSYWRGRAPLA